MPQLRIWPVLAFVLVTLLGVHSARALTQPIAGAVAFPAGTQLYLPFPAGANVYVLSGYSPSGGSSLHADTDACCKANDHYALDLNYADEPQGGKGLPLVAPIPGKVLRAGWATAGWANYGLRVILEHDLGDGHVYHSLYAHMNAIDPAVTEGADVAVGQTLGELGQSCMGALSCGSFSTPHLHWAIHRDSTIGGSGTGGSYGGNAVVPEVLDGYEDIVQGMTLASSNSRQVVCGDGVCSGGETNATCPGDCPSCTSVPPLGRTIDETDLCFERAGSPQYWHEEPLGNDGSLLWTYATTDPPDNRATWWMTFDEAGDYLVEAYVEPGFAGSKQARYELTHAGSTDDAIVDQAASSGWIALGTLAFAAGGDQRVHLADETGEPVGDLRVLVFDAVRLTRIGVTSGASNGAGGGSGSGGSGGGVRSPSGAGGGASSASGDPPNAADGTGDDAGCGCALPGPAGASRALALGLALFAIAGLRRRR